MINKVEKLISSTLPFRQIEKEKISRIDSSLREIERFETHLQTHFNSNKTKALNIISEYKDIIQERKKYFSRFPSFDELERIYKKNIVENSEILEEEEISKIITNGKYDFSRFQKHFSEFSKTYDTFQIFLTLFCAVKKKKEKIFKMGLMSLKMLKYRVEKLFAKQETFFAEIEEFNEHLKNSKSKDLITMKKKFNKDDYLRLIKMNHEEIEQLCLEIDQIKEKEMMSYFNWLDEQGSKLNALTSHISKKINEIREIPIRIKFFISLPEILQLTISEQKRRKEFESKIDEILVKKYDIPIIHQAPIRRIIRPILFTEQNQDLLRYSIYKRINSRDGSPLESSPISEKSFSPKPSHGKGEEFEREISPEILSLSGISDSFEILNLANGKKRNRAGECEKDEGEVFTKISQLSEENTILKQKIIELKKKEKKVVRLERELNEMKRKIKEK